MKFINYLTSITGIGIFPLISLLVFVTFFILLGFYVWRADKDRFKYLAAMPVEKDEKDKPTGTHN
jgi:hypothetical protein